MNEHIQTSHERHIDRCKGLIEEKLGWGPSESWVTQDFEELSVRIQEVSGQIISVTTLKRIWGRIVYDNKPNRHTLDALASFIGHDSWRSLVVAGDATDSKYLHASPVNKGAKRGRPKKRRIAVLLFSTFMLLLGGKLIYLYSLGYLRSDSQRHATQQNVRFISQSSIGTLPATVFFEYDVSDVKADSFYIQERSYDLLRRSSISPSNNVFSSIYFYPGYFKAKLIANEEAILELPVHIETDGWAVILDKGASTPVYLPADALLKDGTLAVSKTWLEAEDYDIDRDGYTLGYYYVKDFSPLRMDNFRLEADILHLKEGVHHPCRGGQLTVHGEHGMIRFPFAPPGCASVMNLTAGEVRHWGETHNLSALGANYTSWQEITLEVKEQSVRIQTGMNPPYTLSYTKDLGHVVGVWFQFVGRGELDNLQLLDERDRVVYEESF